jgi:hypothetical protein
VERVAGRARERVRLRGADLGLDVDRAQERERAPSDGGACEVEVERDVAATAKVDAPGDVEEPGEFGEPVAVRVGCDLGELVPQLVRE